MRINGHCPMGCGETLFVGKDGYLTCSKLKCPRPTAADELLADRETEHVVEFGETGFTVRHPLRERLDDELMRCQLHEHIAALTGPPVKPGRYRARVRADVGWTWEPIPAPSQAIATHGGEAVEIVGSGVAARLQAPALSPLAQAFINGPRSKP